MSCHRHNREGAYMVRRQLSDKHFSLGSSPNAPTALPWARRTISAMPKRARTASIAVSIGAFQGGTLSSLAVVLASAWPEVVQLLRRGSFGVLDFRRREARGEQGKYRAGGRFCVDSRIAVHAIMNAFQERRSAANGGARTRVPAFVIKAAQQRRQLRADVDGFVAPHGVTQCMQRCEQNQINSFPIAPTETPHKVIDPLFSRIHGGVQLF